jgi:hypothetical protein
MSAFATRSWLGSHDDFFEACSAFTHVTACLIAKSPIATLYTEGFDGFVTSTAAPIATGRSDQLPDGTLTRKISVPFHGALRGASNSGSFRHFSESRRHAS